VASLLRWEPAVSGIGDARVDANLESGLDWAGYVA
jgi:hypothetical protein